MNKQKAQSDFIKLLVEQDKVTKRTIINYLIENDSLSIGSDDMPIVIENNYTISNVEFIYMEFTHKFINELKQNDLIKIVDDGKVEESYTICSGVERKHLLPYCL